MRVTEMVYSSHDRCEHIHRDWLVQRALESWDNKTILYLPMSSGAQNDQEYSWGTFSWYFDRFRRWGLEPRTFFWKDELPRDAVQLFFDWLLNSEVVILGGGSTTVGHQRYRALGGKYFGNPDAFFETLRGRQAQGKLTAGFSAGADQLCELSGDNERPLFGLIHKVIVTLHHERGREGHLQYLAERHPDCLVFGLPNDSGIAVSQGLTWRGNYWQLIQCVTDQSWDKPDDQHHIKTRQGVKIEHRYADGRGWQFNGGDELLRVFYPGGAWEAWSKRPQVPNYYSYGSQGGTHYHSIEHVLSDR
ncbi:MAG: hypothetical protein HY815_02930 [Candidatus Riflebacteria bacterium]|nr:hypothetical protein [Candidatus Riflebacteria bacterium]